MTITDRLVQLDGQLIEFNEGQWGQNLPRAVGYHSFNDAGVECETGEFLYAMVRLLQPKKVLETGTHWGVSAAYMGMALQDNGQGHLDTFEFSPENHLIASQRINRTGLKDQVNVYYGDVAAFTPTEQYQLMFLDTEPQTRFSELQKFWTNLDEGGFVFIHDLHRHMAQVQEVHPDHPEIPFWPYGPVTEFMKDLVKSGQARPFHFSTPRGFTGFYKVSSQDYNWS